MFALVDMFIVVIISGSLSCDFYGCIVRHVYNHDYLWFS